MKLKVTEKQFILDDIDVTTGGKGRMIIEELMRINEAAGSSHGSITKALAFCSLFMQMEKELVLTVTDIDRIVEMAWEDRTPFEAIHSQFGLDESAVIALMRSEMKASSFRMWRERMKGRNTKHLNLGSNGATRFRCSRQRSISGNKISKR